MKKVLWILVILLLVGCKKEEEKIKYQLSDTEKLAIVITNSDYHFVVDTTFSIEKDSKKLVDFKFISKNDCEKITSSESLEIIKEKDNGIIYQDDKYHYLYDNNIKVCVLFDSQDLANLEKVLDNIRVEIIEES